MFLVRLHFLEEKYIFYHVQMRSGADEMKEILKKNRKQAKYIHKGGLKIIFYL